MLNRVSEATLEFIALALVFAAATILSQGISALKPTDRQKRNWRVNLSYFAFDIILALPVMFFFAQSVRALMDRNVGPLGLFDENSVLSPFVIMFLALFISDLVGYFRHRIMHYAPLWPIHAAHHSDEDVTWFTLVRFHPLNRLVAVTFDVVVLSLLDFPIWAVVFSNRIRHFYGYFVHSDISWRYGPLKYIFVSPFLHRWHHATDLEARDKNFATIFSLFDVVFGTFYCPQKKAVSLGVDDPDYPNGFLGQTLYPFVVWASARTADASDARAVTD